MFVLAFAFSKSFALLFIARAIQGIGSACSSVSGTKREKNSPIRLTEMIQVSVCWLIVIRKMKNEEKRWEQLSVD